MDISPDIEQFYEDDFIDNAEEAVFIQDVFRNLVQDVPDDINHFHLDFEEDFDIVDDINNFDLDFEEENEIDIVDHNNVWNDPVYFNNDDAYDSAYSEGDLDEDIEDDTDSLISWCGENSVCSFYDLGYDGWLSSEDKDEMESQALGYAIDYDLINQQDRVWEEFIISTRTNYLLGDYTNEWHFFYLQMIEDHLFDISQGFSTQTSTGTC